MSNNPDDDFLKGIARQAVSAAEFEGCSTPEAIQAAKERAHRFAQESLKSQNQQHMHDALKEWVVEMIAQAQQEQEA